MDSITQAALGATIAGAIAGKNCNAKVLLIGAALGTLPDLDVFIDFGDDVSNTIKHRGFTHSLFLIPLFSLLLTWVYCRFKPDNFWHVKRVFALIFAVLVTHPLLDTMTTYGTQLLWPFVEYFEVSNIFIIDPLYTLPLLIAIAIGFIAKQKASRACQIALAFSSFYLLWGLAAQQMIQYRVQENLLTQNLPNQQILITPTAFSTILWRILVIDENEQGEREYWEGLASLLDKDKKIDFIQKSAGIWPLSEKPETLLGLEAFSQGFLSYDMQDDNLIVTDLRLGIANAYSFRFAYAQRDNKGNWQLLAKPILQKDVQNLDLLPLLWQRLSGNQGINAHLQTTG